MSGNKKHWFIISKDTLLKDFYDCELRQVLKSSMNEEPYKANICNRKDKDSDPLVSMVVVPDIKDDKKKDDGK
jgi:hypothetical protein